MFFLTFDYFLFIFLLLPAFLKKFLYQIIDQFFVLDNNQNMVLDLLDQPKTRRNQRILRGVENHLNAFAQQVLFYQTIRILGVRNSLRNKIRLLRRRL